MELRVTPAHPVFSRTPRMHSVSHVHRAATAPLEFVRFAQLARPTAWSGRHVCRVNRASIVVEKKARARCALLGRRAVMESSAACAKPAQARLSPATVALRVRRANTAWMALTVFRAWLVLNPTHSRRRVIAAHSSVQTRIRPMERSVLIVQRGTHLTTSVHTVSAKRTRTGRSTSGSSPVTGLSTTLTVSHRTNVQCVRRA